MLIVRSSGGGALSLEIIGSDSQPPEKLEAPMPANLSDVSELKYEVRRTGTVVAKLGGTTVGSWPFQVIPDLPPKISITKEPERTPRGGLKFAFKVEDDYGVSSAETRIRRVDAQAGHLPDRLGPRRGQEGPALLPMSGRRRWRCGCRAAIPSRPKAPASTRSATIPGPA